MTNNQPSMTQRDIQLCLYGCVQMLVHTGWKWKIKERKKDRKRKCI